MKSDALIQQDVMDELQCQPSINALHVGVGVRGGSVTLVGHVGSHSEKWQVERAVRAVPEVEAIFNELEIRPWVADNEYSASALGPLDLLATDPSPGTLDLEFDAAWRRRANALARNAVN